MVSAPLPPRIIEKCLASDRIVIATVISKYCNHTPLHRQSVILGRDIGLEISRATLDGWVLKVGELLIPIVAAMRRELISGSYIQVDETPVDVQMHEGRGKNHQAYLWRYSRPGGTVVFDFRLGRGRDGPKRFLGQFEGILQTDGYTAYDQIGGTRMVHAACWAYARRQVFEAVQLNPRDPVATPIVARMDELFAVDAEARRRAIGLTGRHALRQEKAKPLLGDIRSKIEVAQSVALPASALSKACQYALTRWKKLTRFLEYPELELSNNLAENSMRAVALGRKNWIHIGSLQAGPKIAAILSVVESSAQAETPGTRLFGRGPPRVCRISGPAPPGPYSRCVGRPAFIDPNAPGASVKVTCDHNRIISCSPHPPRVGALNSREAPFSSSEISRKPTAREHILR